MTTVMRVAGNEEAMVMAVRWGASDGDGNEEGDGDGDKGG